MTEQHIAELVTSVQREIIADIRAGVVPATVERFSDLHAHVDANEYLPDEDDFTVVADVQDRVDDWLRDGGHRSATA